jgi:hypothetical protein
VEAMSKFNKNDKITRSSMDAKWARIGFKAVVLDGNMYLDALGEVNEIIDDYWELATPKWTIYNNTLPWSDLSDKQKGKMLLANNQGITICIDGYIKDRPYFMMDNSKYKAIKKEPVKPEPTMETVFANDWFNECGQSPKNMVAKGWVKL